MMPTLKEHTDCKNSALPRIPPIAYTRLSQILFQPLSSSKHSMAENGHTARYSHSTVIDMDPVSPHAPADNFSFHGSVNDLELNRDDHSHYQQHQPDSIPPTAPNLDLFRRNINSSLSKLRKRKRPSAVSPGSSQQPSFDNEETTDLLIQLRNDLQIYTRADSSPQAATDL
jgi:hypothetical protein